MTMLDHHLKIVDQLIRCQLDLERVQGALDLCVELLASCDDPADMRGEEVPFEKLPAILKVRVESEWSEALVRPRKGDGFVYMVDGGSVIWRR